MVSDFHFFERSLAELNIMLGTYVSDVAVRVIAAITPVATQLLTLYIILWGFSVMRGMIQEAFIDGVFRLFKLCVIFAVAVNIAYYNAYLAEFLFNTPEQFAAVVVANSSGISNVQFLDILMSRCYDMGDAFWQKAHASGGWMPDLGLLSTAILIWLVGLVTTAYGAFLLLLSKMALAILLGIGPVFVLLLLFEPTKRFFDAWIGQALNFVFLAILTAAAIKLILSILEKYLFESQKAGVLADPSINQALPALALSAIGFLVLMQLPSIASALGGGVAINTLGAAGWAFDKVKRGVSSLRPTSLRRSYLHARSDARLIGRATGVAPASRAIYRKITGQGRAQSGDFRARENPPSSRPASKSPSNPKG